MGRRVDGKMDSLLLVIANIASDANESGQCRPRRAGVSVAGAGEKCVLSSEQRDIVSQNIVSYGY